MSDNVKCRIQWVDCNGKPTPDDNPAVGFAVANFSGQVTRYPICAAHLASLGQVHHGKCKHASYSAAPGCTWTFEPFESEACCGS